MRMPGPHNCYDPHTVTTTGEYCEEGCNDIYCNIVHTRCPGGRPPTVAEMVEWMREQGAVNPIPWCRTHESKFYVDDEACGVGIETPYSADCQLEEPQAVYRIEANE